MSPRTEAPFYLTLPPRMRIHMLERVRHCIDLLHTLSPEAGRNDCIDMLDRHLYEIFAAHYDRPIAPFVSRVPVSTSPPPVRRTGLKIPMMQPR